MGGWATRIVCFLLVVIRLVTVTINRRGRVGKSKQNKKLGWVGGHGSCPEEATLVVSVCVVHIVLVIIRYIRIT